MPVTRVGVQAVTGSPGQVVDIDPARITATIANAGSVTVEYSVNSGNSWASIAASGSAAASCNTNELRLRRTGSGAYPVPVDIDWTAQSEGEANSLTAAQASSVSGDGSVIRDDATAAAANADALNALLAAGQAVTLNTPGIIWLSKPIRLRDQSRLTVAPGVWPKLVNSAKCAIIRNRDAQNALPVSAMSIVGGVVTLAEKGHDYAVGETVYVEGCLTNTTLNGAKVVTATVPGVSWSYAGTGALPTNTNEQRIMTSVYNPLAGANFTRASNVVTVLDAKRRQQGDHVYITGLTDASFNGKAKILSTITGVSWTYASTGADGAATGTANVLGNTGIQLELRYDGNRAGQAPENAAGLDEWLDFPCQFINVGNMLVNAPAIQNFWWRGLGFWNAGQIDVPLCRFYRGSVGIQFDGFCDNIRVGTALGTQMSDDVLAWGVTDQSGPFGETSSPSGPGNMGSLKVEVIDGDSPTGLFKQYCATGYDLGDMDIGVLRGSGRGIAGDSSAGVSGGTAKRLRVRYFGATPAAAGQFGINLAGLASLQSLVIDESVDNYSSQALTFFLRSAIASVGSIKLLNHTSLTFCAGTYGAVQIESSSVVDDLFMSGRLTAGVASTAGVPAVNVASTGRVRNLTWQDVSIQGGGANGSGNYYGRGIVEAAGGRIDKITLRNVTMPTGQLDGFVVLGGGATATEININGVSQGYADDTTSGKPASVFSDNSSAKSITAIITALNIRDVANRVFQFAGSGTNRIQGSGATQMTAAPYRFALLTTGTHSTSIDVPDAWVDLGASAGAPPARLVPRVGDRLINANATGRGAYIRTDAGAWTAI